MSRKIHGHDTANLPKWAREHIEVLHRDVEHWKNQALAAAGENAEGAPIVVGIDRRDERGLPDEVIRFYPDPSDRSLYIQVRREGRGIDINATRPVVLRMRSSNTFQLDPEEF